MARRSLAITGWLAAVVVATLVGIGAIHLVGDSITGTPGGVRSQDEVARDLAAATATTTPQPTATPAATPASTTPPAGHQEVFSASGNTVTAACADGLVKIVTWSAAQGYGKDDIDAGPDQEVEAKFRGDAGRAEIKIRCGPGDRPVQVGHDD